MNNSKTVFFIPSNENHVKLFLPLYKTLAGQYRVVFFSQDEYKDELAEKTLVDYGLPFKTFNDYEKRDPTFILSKENTNLIIIGNDTDVIPQWFVNVSNTLHIPSIMIQDGLFFNIKNFNPNSFSKKIDLLKKKSSVKLFFLAFRLLLTKKYKRVTDGNGGCTQIHVWGNASKDYFILNGVNDTKIIITGNPRLDDYEIKGEEKKHSDEKIILYAPSDLIKNKIMGKNNVKKLIKDIFVATTSFQNMKLIIKPHVGENKNLYEDIAKQYNAKFEILDNDFQNLLFKSDILISNISTTVIDGISKGKPVIIFLPNIDKITDEKTFPRDLIEKNVVLYANDNKSLAEKINAILTGKFNALSNMRDLAIEDYFGPTDKKSTQRSIEHINNLLNK
jgi:hypothetical protein